MDRRSAPIPVPCTQRPARPAPLCAKPHQTLSGHTKTGISLDRTAARIACLPARITARAGRDFRTGMRVMRAGSVVLCLSKFVMRARGVALRAGVVVMGAWMVVMRAGKLVRPAAVTVMRTLLAVSPLAASDAPASSRLTRRPALLRQPGKRETPAAEGGSPGWAHSTGLPTEV